MVRSYKDFSLIFSKNIGEKKLPIKIPKPLISNIKRLLRVEVLLVFRLASMEYPGKLYKKIDNKSSL